MMRDDSATTANNQQNWFEYAYYSSAVDETADAGAPKAPRMKLQ